MKMRKQKKQIPADFRKQMYENYKANMAFYGKPISSRSEEHTSELQSPS